MRMTWKVHTSPETKKKCIHQIYMHSICPTIEIGICGSRLGKPYNFVAVFAAVWLVINHKCKFVILYQESF